MLIAALNVRNESAVIARCIESAARFATRFVIIDTGSTDDTQAIVKATCERLGKPLALWQVPWKNYAANQTILLEKARQASATGFTWILDADETIEGEPPELDPAIDAYHVNRVLAGDWDNWCLRVFNNRSPWRYKGERHALPVCDTKATLADLPTEVINSREDSANGQADPEAQRARFIVDAKMFAIKLKANPNDTRSAYYLAQSLKDAGKHEAAIEAYAHRAQMGGSLDERYLSHWMLGEYGRLNRWDIGTIERHWGTCIAMDPKRLDARVSLATLHNAIGEHENAKLGAQVAIAIENPTGRFLTRRSNKWRRYWELFEAQCALKEDASETVEALLAQDIPLPERTLLLRHVETQ